MVATPFAPGLSQHRVSGMRRPLLCLVLCNLLVSCASTRAERRVCSKRGFATSGTIQLIQREYGQAEFRIARDVLAREDRRPCWGNAGLVAAVLGQGEASGLLRDRLDAMIRLDEDRPSSPNAVDLLLSVGIAARFDPHDARRAATIGYLTRLADPTWWATRKQGSHAAGSGIGPAMKALAALSQTGSPEAGRFFARLLDDVHLEARFGWSTRSFVSGLARVNRQRMSGALLEGPTCTPGDGHMADALLALPTWAPENRPVHAPGPGWTTDSPELVVYWNTARSLARMRTESIVRDYAEALDRAARGGDGLRLQYNLYALNRMLFVLPETEPLGVHRAFVTEPGLRLPPARVVHVRWPVRTNADGRIVGLAPPTSLLISAYDAIGEFEHFAARHPRRPRDDFDRWP